MSEKDIGEPVKSMLKREYQRGYQQAENDYYKNTEKDRQSSYDSGYLQGYSDGVASVKDLGKLYSEIRAEVIDDCKSKLNECWLNGTVANRIVRELQDSLEQLKEQK